MTLTIRTEKDDRQQMMLTIEVDEQRVEKAMRQKARTLAREVNIPGFRRGKAPYHVLLRRVGRDVLRAEVIEDLVPTLFEEAIEQSEIEPYAQSSLDDLESEPLVLKFTVPLSPEVTLTKNYRAIRKEIEPVVITDEAVQEALEHIQSHHQVLEPVERPIEPGDLVTVSGRGVVIRDEEVAETDDQSERETTAVADEGVAEAPDATVEAGPDDEEQPDNKDVDDHVEADVVPDDVEEERDDLIFDEDSIDLIMDGAKLFPGTPFVESLIGLSAGDETAFGFLFPEDYEDEALARKKATFEITILNVQSRELPPLDDELAQQEGNYETLDELRSVVRENLQERAEAEAQDVLLEGMIDDLLQDAEIVYPPAAVESEIDDMVEGFKNQITRSGWKWEDFQQIQGMDEESIRDNFRENAGIRLRRRLAMRQFVLDEKLKVENEDIDAALEKRLSSFSDNAELRESMSNYYRSGYGFDTLSSEILMKKAHGRIKAILTGNAPDLEMLEREAAVDPMDVDEEE